MDKQSSPKTRRDIEAKIIAKAWKNETFKQELLTNSKAVIEQEFGVQFPEAVNVQVQEENPTSLYFVLPMSPQIEGQEISEEELDAVAGGGTPGALITVSIWVSAEIAIDKFLK